MSRIDHEAFSSLAAWWDSIFMTPRIEEEEGDGLRDMALDEKANPCDSEDTEEDGIE